MERCGCKYNLQWIFVRDGPAVLVQVHRKFERPLLSCNNDLLFDTFSIINVSELPVDINSEATPFFKFALALSNCYCNKLQFPCHTATHQLVHLLYNFLYRDFEMLNIFFKRKDYKEVTVKYLDQLTNDIEKLQFKRIAGMTAANEYTSKNTGYMEASSTADKSQIVFHKSSRDTRRNYEDIIGDVITDRPSRSSNHDRSNSRSNDHGHKHASNRGDNHGHKSTMLAADYQEGNTTASSSTLNTSENKTSDSFDVPLIATGRKSHTSLSRKAMAESMDSLKKEITDLKAKIAIDIIASDDEARIACNNMDSMQEEIGELKAMMTSILTESRKNASGAEENTLKLQEEIEGLKVKVAMVTAINSEKDWRFLSCASVKADDSSSDVDEKEDSSAGRKREHKWLDRDNYCGNNSYNGCPDFFNFIKCTSSLD